MGNFYDDVSPHAANSPASFTIPSWSSAKTSAEIAPSGRIFIISFITSLKSRQGILMRLGFVVTPSMIPHEATFDFVCDGGVEKEFHCWIVFVGIF